MRNHRVAGLGAAALFFAAGVAEAQTAPQLAVIISKPSIQAIAEDHCVLHVWPAGDAHSSYTGWFHGGAVDGDRRGIKGYPDMHGAALNTAAQRDLLSKFDWAGRRHLPGLTVVVHGAPPPPDDDLGRNTALTADHPDC